MHGSAGHAMVKRLSISSARPGRWRPDSGPDYPDYHGRPRRLPSAMRNVIGDGVMNRTNRHLANHLEQNHRGIKQRLPLLQHRRTRLQSVKGPLYTVWALVILAFVVVGVPGCTQQAETPVYRIGLGPWVEFGPLYLARDKGFFKEASVSADLIVLTGIAERNSALKSGKLDALAAPVDYFVLSAGNGLVTTIVMAIDESVGGDGIVAKQSILQFADLRGEKSCLSKRPSQRVLLTSPLAAASGQYRRDPDDRHGNRTSGSRLPYQ